MSEDQAPFQEIELTKDQLDADADAEAVEALLKGLAGTGHQLQIHRMTPTWCAGFLDTLPMDEGINLTELRDTFGGERLRLRVLNPNGTYKATRTIRIADKPRVRGEEIKPGPLYTDGGQKIIDPAPGAAAAAAPFIEALKLQNQQTLEQLRVAQQQNQELMLEMIKQKNTSSDPLEQMKTMLTMFTSVKELTDSFGGGGKDGSEIGQAMGLFSDFLKERRAAAEIAQREKRVHREPLPLPGGASQRLAEQRATIPASSAPASPPSTEIAGDDEDGDEDADGLTISDELTDLGPEETVKILNDVFERWTPEQQRKAMAYMTGAASVDNSEPAEQDTRSGVNVDGNESS